MDCFVLILNAVLWGSIFLILYNRYGLKNIGVLFFGFYTLINLFAPHYYLISDENSKYQGQNLFFLLYLLFFIFLFCLPLIKLDNQNKVLVVKKRKSIITISIIISILGLIGINDILTNFYQGMIRLSLDDSYGASLYHDLRMSMDEGKSGASNYMAVFTNIARSISPLFFFIYLTFPKKNRILLIGLFLSSISTLLHGVSIGSRFAIIDGLMCMIFMLIFMWKYYNKEIKKILFLIIISVFSIIILGFVFISLSRSNKIQSNPSQFFEKYITTSVLNFGKYGLDNGEIRNGDKTAPLIKSLFSSDVARTYKMRLEKYRKMKINESSFSTFIGDFVFDYGVLDATLIMLLMVYFFYRGINAPPMGKIYTSQIILVYFLISILNGFYAYPMSDYLGNMKALILIGLYFFFLPYRHVIKK